MQSLAVTSQGSDYSGVGRNALEGDLIGEEVKNLEARVPGGSTV